MWNLKTKNLIDTEITLVVARIGGLEVGEMGEDNQKI